MEDFGYIYDSSIGIPPLRTPIWPYTLDYKIPHECKSGTCPTKSYPGKLNPRRPRNSSITTAHKILPENISKVAFPASCAPPLSVKQSGEHETRNLT